MTSLKDKIPHWSFYRFSFLVFTAVFGLYFIVPEYIYQQVWIILVFFFLLTLGSLLVIEKFTKKNSKNFLGVYFTAMIARLFISIIFATIFILTDRANVFNFAINFLFLYLLFLGFEIYGIITNLRTHFKKGSGDE